MSQEQITIFAVIGGLAVFGLIVIMLLHGSTNEIREVLRNLATAAGWRELRNAFFAGAGLKGFWRSFPVELSYFGRQKSVPQRLILKVRAQTDSRLILKRKFPGWLTNKPFAWFGLPLIDVQHPASADLWIRGDQSLAMRVLNEGELAKQILENLVARFDEIRIDGNGLRVTRALDERAVKEKYGMASFAMRLNLEKLAIIAREELTLGETIVGKLENVR